LSGNLSGHLEGVTVGDGLTDAAGSALEPVDSLMKYDSYLVLADYQAYVNSQERLVRLTRIETTGLESPFSILPAWAIFI
jgi:hypothetical protein